MKTLRQYRRALVLLCALFAGRTDASAAEAQPSTGVNHISTDPSAHSRLWWRTITVTNELDEVSTSTNFAYVEVASGLNYLDSETGTWKATEAEFEVTPQGYAVARRGLHKVDVSPTLNDAAGTVTITTPEGRLLRGTILGLTLYDRASGTNLLLAEVTNAVGRLVAPNVILFTNGFAGLSADVRLVYEASGFHQEVVLKEALNRSWLQAAGFDPDSPALQLEIWTEWFEAPEPIISSRIIARETDPVLRAAMAEPDMVEERLDFGEMKMPMGKAYFESGTNESRSVSVSKRWVHAGNRRFLVESIPLTSLALISAQLPPARPGTMIASASRGGFPGMGARPGGTTVAADIAGRRAPSPKLEQKKEQKILLAQADRNKTPGVILDYMILNYNTNDFTFRGDTTYYISAAINISGTTTIEGSTVIKYIAGGALTVGAMNCDTGPYRPAIFTAKDDDTAGQQISDSTGTPSGYYAGAALKVEHDGNTTVKHVRIAHASIGLAFAVGETNTVRHVQILHCSTAVETGENDGDQYLDFGNGLVVDAANVFDGYIWFGTIAHLTADDCGTLVSDWGYGDSTYYFTNAILSRIDTLLGNGVLGVAGSYNAFYNTPTFGSVQFTNYSVPFQTVIDGNYYLTTNRNVATTGIDATLLSDLRKRTTYPPQVYSNVTVTTDLTLSPYAQRDTDLLDLGYHYSPLDCLVRDVLLTNVTLTVTEGTVLGSYGFTGGFKFINSTVTSIGSPFFPNWFVHHSLVQENPQGLGSPYNFYPQNTGQPGLNGTFRFNNFVRVAGQGSFFHATNVWIRDCEFWNGQQLTFYEHVWLKNNLFCRTELSAQRSSLFLTNNLFYGTKVQLAGGNWAYDNAFDKCVIYGIGITNNYNAYVGCTALFSPPAQLFPTNATDIVRSSFTYTNGTFGRFYQFSTDLSNAGSTGADAAGLVHYTTVPDPTFYESLSTVDIGLHYLALDANGKLRDADGDRIPDYLEDLNGNGAINPDPGETKRDTASDVGLKVWITRPRSNSDLP